LTGTTSSSSDSSYEDVSGLTGFLLTTGFWRGDFALRAGDAALGATFVTFALTGTTSSDSYYYEDS